MEHLLKKVVIESGVYYYEIYPWMFYVAIFMSIVTAAIWLYYLWKMYKKEKIDWIFTILITSLSCLFISGVFEKIDIVQYVSPEMTADQVIHTDKGNTVTFKYQGKTYQKLTSNDIKEDDRFIMTTKKMKGDDFPELFSDVKNYSNQIKLKKVN